MFYKEYNFENGKKVELDKLYVGFVPLDEYVIAHKTLPILCHDVMIKYEGGLLLTIRKGVPAKGILWPFGGRLERGLSLEDSLKKRVKSESGLSLRKLKIIGISRHYWYTDPFGHEKGTDTPSIMFYGEGEGELKLNHEHEKPMIVTPENYTEKFQKELHPFIKDFIDLAIPFIK